jgi:demethylmenaquinone methyltransferase/2-methoxy-6-polyprenyl-1,4-benzoquinol methylase
MSTATRPGSGAMFDGIARRYDLLNRVLSFGVDRLWRGRLVRSLALGADARVLDLATGTGDVALDVVRRHPSVHVTGVDPSAGMLAVGQDKVARAGVTRHVTLVTGDAQALSFPDASFDAVTIAFGIRNVPDRPRALAEMRRVLKPGGRLGILELAEPRGFLGAAARFHVRTLVPRLGALLSGDREYRYLQESIARFPHHTEFVPTIAAAGFDDVRARPMTFGACVLFTARVGGSR